MESGQTLQVTRTTTHGHVRTMAIHPQWCSYITEALLPSGFCSTTMSVPCCRCYTHPRPILSWRFAPSRADRRLAALYLTPPHTPCSHMVCPSGPKVPLLPFLPTPSKRKRLYLCESATPGFVEPSNQASDVSISDRTLMGLSTVPAKHPFLPKQALA